MSKNYLGIGVVVLALAVTLVFTGCDGEETTTTTTTPTTDTEATEDMTLQAAKKLTDTKAKEWAEDAVLEKFRWTEVDENGIADTWKLQYCSLEKGTANIVTVSKGGTPTLNEQDSCTHDEQGSEDLALDSKEVLEKAAEEIDAYKADNPEAVVKLSLTRYTGGDWHYLWEVHLYPDQAAADEGDSGKDMRILMDDGGNITAVNDCKTESCL
ncbi:hypothetical protein ACFL2B_03245 [Patescibacteria group bacterium]